MGLRPVKRAGSFHILLKFSRPLFRSGSPLPRNCAISHTRGMCLTNPHTAGRACGESEIKSDRRDAIGNQRDSV